MYRKLCVNEFWDFFDLHKIPTDVPYAAFNGVLSTRDIHVDVRRDDEEYMRLKTIDEFENLTFVKNRYGDNKLYFIYKVGVLPDILDDSWEKPYRTCRSFLDYNRYVYRTQYLWWVNKCAGNIVRIERAGNYCESILVDKKMNFVQFVTGNEFRYLGNNKYRKFYESFKKKERTRTSREIAAEYERRRREEKEMGKE